MFFVFVFVLIVIIGNHKIQTDLEIGQKYYVVLVYLSLWRVPDGLDSKLPPGVIVIDREGVEKICGDSFNNVNLIFDKEWKRQA